MEDDSFLTHSDEYRLLEVYEQQKRKSKVRHLCFKLGDERFRDVADKLSQIVESGSIVEDGLQHDGFQHHGLQHDGLQHDGLQHDGLQHDGLQHVGLQHVGLQHDGLQHDGLQHHGLQHHGLQHHGLQHHGESDSEDFVDVLVELLKKSGDDLNEKIKLNRVLLGYLQDSFTYSMFEKLTTSFIKSVVPEHQQSVRNREQIAWTFEVTTRLKALDLHPMNRIMGFGATYIKDHFTPWVQRHGGWEKAFDDDEEEVH